MIVQDLLKNKSDDIVSISPDKSIKDAMKLIIEKKIGALPVLDGEELLGILSERDIFRVIYDKHDSGFEMKVGDIMTKNIVIGFREDDVENVRGLMTNNRFRHLPIMDNKKLVGIISIGDVVKGNAQKLKVENRYLKDYIAGKYPA